MFSPWRNDGFVSSLTDTYIRASMLRTVNIYIIFDFSLIVYNVFILCTLVFFLDACLYEGIRSPGIIVRLQKESWARYPCHPWLRGEGRRRRNLRPSLATCGIQYQHDS